MSDINDGIPPITAPWPKQDIVYISIMGTVMLAAFLEWFLWLAAFLYCLIKVFQKADHWSTRVLAVLIMILFTALRAIFLPVMVVTLPLPPQITQYFPRVMVWFLQWFAFWTFAGLLIIPWLFCVYQLVTNSVGRTKRIKTVLDEHSAPKTVIVMPVYKEEPDVLVTAIDSVVDCDYPPSCLHVFLSFDGDQEDELYLKTIEKLGVPLVLQSYPSSIDVDYRNARITISRFPHGGKRHCQKSTFKLIDKIYTEYLKRNDNLFILFIDSDCILDKVCIQNFMYEMELKPGSKQNMLAMTGVITSTTVKNSLITLLQDMEYIHGQLFERSVESGCGSVTCLPGALTMLRFSAFRKMAKYYFADKAEQCEDLFDYGKCHLGEDRWLTHLFMIGAKERYQIQMCTGAFCKTEAVQTYKSLMKQRRRWFLGFITNEACMLTDIRLWRRYPLLVVVRLMQNTIRTTALLFFIMVLSIITTENKVANLPVGFIAVSLGLNWLLMLYFGAKLRRFKIWLYPVMFVINPFFNWAYMVYGIFTAGQRTWGGPRADAGTADVHTTAQQAIEHAEATGDDLNVVPETFKPATEAQHPDKQPYTIPLQPSDRVEGRFAPPERLPGGWYMQNSPPGLTVPDVISGYPNIPIVPLRRDSSDSFITVASSNSVYTPKPLASLISDERRRKAAHVREAQQSGNRYRQLPLEEQDIGMREASRNRKSNSRDSVVETGRRISSNPFDTEPSNPEFGPAALHLNDSNLDDSYFPEGQAVYSTARTQAYHPVNSADEAAQIPMLPQDLLHSQGCRSVVASRNMRHERSPLGRLPVTRSGTPDDTAIELSERQAQEMPFISGDGPASPAATDTRQTRQPSGGSERKSRNRLKKKRRGSTSTS